MSRVENYSYSPYGQIVHGAESVSLSDTVSYNGVQGFMINADGTLAVEMADGSDVALVVKAGVAYPLAVKKVKSTGSSGITTVILLY